MQEKTESVAATPGEQILMRLVQSSLAKERICALVTRAHQPIKLCSVSAIITGLRKKLSTYGVEVTTIFGFGYALRREDRAKALELLAARPKPTHSAAVDAAGQPAGDVLVRKSDPQGRVEPGEPRTRLDAA
jgi:hypothetical protein